YTITYYDTTLYLFHFSFGLRPPISTLFPYTTLFRSRDRGRSGRPARAPPAGRARDRVREPGSRPRTVPGDAAPRPRLRRRAAEARADRCVPDPRRRRTRRTLPAEDVLAAAGLSHAHLSLLAAAPGPQPVAAVPVRRHPRHPPGQGFPQRPGGAADAALEPELRRDPFRRLPVRDDR